MTAIAALFGVFLLWAFLPTIRAAVRGARYRRTSLHRAARRYAAVSRR